MSEAIGIVERLNDLRLAAFRAGGFDTPAAKTYYRALSTAFQRDELVDAAETSRLTARIAELEKALKDAQQTMRNAWGAVTTNQIADKGVAEMLKDGVRRARTTLEASEKK